MCNFWNHTVFCVNKTETVSRAIPALWDVIASCDITGSSDSSIKNIVTYDLTVILNNADIKQIFVNGKAAEKYHNKYICDVIKRESVCLPSTSPTNAGRSVKKLINAWGAIKEYYER